MVSSRAMHHKYVLTLSRVMSVTVFYDCMWLIQSNKSDTDISCFSFFTDNWYYSLQVLWSKTLFTNPAGICLFKFKLWNCLNNLWNLSRVNNNDTRMTSTDVVLVYLLLTLKRFKTLFWWIQLWTNQMPGRKIAHNKSIYYKYITSLQPYITKKKNQVPFLK